MRPRMTHVCLHVDNLKNSIDFYRRYCGMEIIDDRSVGGEGSIYLAETGREAELVFQFKSGGKTQALANDEERHFGFVVESREAVDKIVEMARQEGIVFFEPGEYLPGAYLFGVKDPNGNCVEFSYGHSVPPT